MMSAGTRLLLRSAVRSTSFAPARTIVGRRLVSTTAPHLRSRSWKSSALRWGVAFAGIYYYNTSPVFAEQPENNLLNPNVDALEGESLTLDALTASSRRKAQKDASILQSAIETTSADAAASESTAHATTNATIAIESPGELEEEAAGEGAFNPETGEINWDCPCLGGMAYGPCGPQFREAFSCFVFSTEDPKGMDCIDKFQAMQTCFREHPEVYKGEIEDEEDLDAELAQEREQLAQEIAERKKVVDEKTQSTTENRLLEEPLKVEKTRKSKKAKKEAEPQAVSSSPNRSEHLETTTASSSEPHPGMSSEHEAIHEGTQATTSTSAIKDELVPRAAYGASNMKPTAK